MKKFITIQIAAILALALFGFVPVAQGSEVTGTLSSGGTATVDDPAPGSGTIGGSVVSSDDEDGGSGSGGGVSGGTTGGGGGAVLGAGVTSLTGQPAVLGAANAIAQAPGLPNTGELPTDSRSATAGWVVMLASALAAVVLAGSAYLALKETKLAGGSSTD